MKTRKSTILDIARELGISKSTVSRALTNSWEISNETRRRVLEKVEEMNYHPNVQARSLVTNRSRIIGFIVPDMFSSTYFTVVARKIQEIFISKGYQLFVTQSNESIEEERRLLELMQDHNVDGVIICTVKDSADNADILSRMIDEGMAMVFISRVCKFVRAPKIVFDDEEMASRLVDHVFEQGCKKPAFISGPEGVLSGTRTSGFIRGCIRHNHYPDESMIVKSGLYMEDGYKATLSLIDSDNRPDAIIAINDTVAFGAIKALKDRKIRIPEEMVVCGFSDSFASTIIDPTLTSTHPPLEELGEKAAAEILHQIEGFDPTDSETILKSELMIRESSLRLHPGE